MSCFTTCPCSKTLAKHLQVCDPFCFAQQITQPVELLHLCAMSPPCDIARLKLDYDAAVVADSFGAASQGDNVPVWDSDEEPQQSDGSFAVADLLAGFTGSAYRANGGSMRSERADDQERASAPAIHAAGDLLGDLGAPPQV